MRTFASLPERLRGLPDFEPPAGGWARLQHRMSAPPRRRRALPALALAASVLAAIGVAVLAPEAPVPSAPASTQVAQLMQQSQRLEQRLDRARPQVVVWNGELAATAAHLRNDLAVVDLQLSYAEPASNPHAVEKLWQNRVALMTRLVQTHEEGALLRAAYATPLEQSL